MLNRPEADTGVLKAGFLFENDESTPYTYNFILARDALQRKYPEQIEILTRTNVSPEETEEPLLDLISKGCRIIFCNNYSEQFYAMAAHYPDVVFCQVSFPLPGEGTLPDNYHTFNGEIYEARYVSGIAAGMKLQQLIDEGTVESGHAAIGYVAGYEAPEVISGYTAFLLGVRSIVPDATMKVRYTNSWSDFTLEKQTARGLIDEGCLIISQHSDTIGPAVACEEADHTVYFIGYNKSMMDVAPDSALLSVRVNWTPYIIGAAEAILQGKSIEKNVSATAFGNDMCAGFDKDWVQILEPNSALLAPGTQEKIDETVAALRRNSINVFHGAYTGTDPNDPSDTVDLSIAFRENSASSTPSFHYILDDVISVQKPD